MKYQDPFVCMVIRRIVPLFLAICWMMLALPAASQTQNLPPPKNPDTGPQTNSDDTAGPSMRDRTKGQQDNPVETLKVNVDVVSLLFNVKDKGISGYRGRQAAERQILQG